MTVELCPGVVAGVCGVIARMCSWSRRCWKRCRMADKMAFGAALFGMSLRGWAWQAA